MEIKIIILNLKKLHNYLLDLLYIMFLNKFI